MEQTFTTSSQKLYKITLLNKKPAIQVNPVVKILEQQFI